MTSKARHEKSSRATTDGSRPARLSHSLSHPACVPPKHRAVDPQLILAETDAAETADRKIESPRNGARTALAALRSALQTVRQKLVGAAQSKRTRAGHVHQLRISTRVAETALRLHANILPGRRSRWIRDALRRIRKAAGAIRDLDVLAADTEPAKTKGVRSLLAEFRRRRRNAIAKLAAIHSELNHRGEMDKRIRKLLRSIDDAPKKLANQPASRWYTQSIQRLLQRVRDNWAAGAANLANLHQFRIGLKRLRYALEMLESRIEPSTFVHLLDLLKQLQKRLGHLQDRAVASEFFMNWRNHHSDPTIAAAAETQHRRAERDLEQLRREFARWWTAARQRELSELIADLQIH